MSLDDYDNHDANILPFADCEIATDVPSDLLDFPKSKSKPKHNHKTKTKKKSNKQQSNDIHKEKNNYLFIRSYIYFENTEEENNFLTLIPYTGPCNTLHLGKSLCLPQIISNSKNDSTVSCQRFIQDYDRIITSLTPSLETMSLSVYLRFGISYIIQPSSIIDQPISLKDYSILRNEGKQIKTSFYTCKGVTSPKHLLTTLTKHNYQQISSNTYSYEIQLYGTKDNQYSILHFQYDEQLQCRSIYYRPDYPINFDFIRNKTSSIFRSIDNSYSDIFDFRIQLQKGKSISETDPNVIDILRGVPINQVLFIDTLTKTLYISKNLQKYFRYMKCKRSSNYQNFNEQILISIGTYEEFQLNSQGQCELLMTASNTMTIELIDLKIIPSGKKLYDIGIWFSTLCQTYVDLPTKLIENNLNKSFKWFSSVSIFRKNSNKSIKHMNVNQLTTYKTQKTQQAYTTEELAFVKKILQEENLRNILLNINDKKVYDRKYIKEIYENIKERLKTSAVPLANEALKKVERAYHILCKEFVE